jgi:hypothetical protein
MEAIIKLKLSELKADLLGVIQKMFNGQSVEIEIHVRHAPSVLTKETKEEYRLRIERAVQNIEKGENVVQFTGEEFEELMTKMKAIK